MNKSISNPKLTQLKVIIKMKTLDNIDFEVKLISKIDQGSTCDVYKVENITKGVLVPRELALKCYKLDTSIKTQKVNNNDLIEHLKSKAKEEVSFLEHLAKLKFPKICQIYGKTENLSHPYHYAIALELANGSLKQEWEKHKRVLPLEQISRILNDCVGVLAYFQSIGMIHSDIKPSNIVLVNETGNVTYKFIDFNSSIDLKALYKESCQLNDNENEIKIPLRGTPIYMSPEYFKIFSQSYDIITLLKNTEKVFEGMDEDDRTKEYESVIVIKKLPIVGSTKTIYGESRGCKNDVFSLGLMIMRLAGIDIKEANLNKEKLDIAIKKFKKLINKPNKEHYLEKVIDKMLEWDPNNRIDFICLKQTLISSHEQLIDNFEYLLPSSVIEKMEIFVGVETFSKIWELKKLDEMNAKLFENLGYKAFRVPSEFYDMVVRLASHSHDCYKKLIDDIKNKYPILFGLGKSNQSAFCTILEKYDESDDDVEEKKFKNLLKIYSKESEFFLYLNKALSLNNFSMYENYIFSLLSTKSKINYEFPIEDDEDESEKTLIFRGISLAEDNEKTSYITHLNQYIPGMSYHWPSFASCSRDKENLMNFLKQKSVAVLFEIELNNKNKSNKIDLKDYSDFSEEEILLLPYFHFEVTKKCSETFDNIVVTKISIKEIEGLILNYKLIWFDPIVNNFENLQYQTMIESHNSKVELIVFEEMEEAIDFIDKTTEPAFVISCGSQGEKFFSLIHEKFQVKKLFIFTSFENKKNHENWTKNYDFHNKLVGVFDNIFDVLSYLPEESIIY